MNPDVNTPSFQYSLGEQYQSRCISSLPNQKRHIFAAGTQSLRFTNQVDILMKQFIKIHIIELDSEQRLQLLQTLIHPGMVDQLIPDPLNQNQLYVIFSECNEMNINNSIEGVRKMSLIACNYDESDVKPQQAQMVFDLSIQRKLQSVVPLQKEPKIIVCDEKSLNSYDLNTQSFFTIMQDDDAEYSICQMDPYHNNLFTRVQGGKQIHILDSREKKAVSIIDKAHDLDITDLDFNPNKQYYFLSAGEDCTVRFWDLRKPQYAMKILDEFHNSVLSAKYNKFHDQLIAISFDDGSIVLYRGTSISSVPQIAQINYQASSKEEDGIVRIYDEHEDSACEVAWSFSTAWVFASIGYNSNIIINMVPVTEKYKILL